MVNIIISNEFGKTNKKEIQDLEKRIKFSIPEDYKNFLLAHNGGKPKADFYKHTFRKKETEYYVAYFYGLHKGEYWATMNWAMESLSNRIPPEFLPIAYDQGGNHYVINLSKEKFGAICFWDQNKESVSTGSTYYRNIKTLAKSFSDFVSNLVADNDDDLDITITETDDSIIID